MSREECYCGGFPKRINAFHVEGCRQCEKKRNENHMIKELIIETIVLIAFAAIMWLGIHSPDPVDRTTTIEMAP